MSHSNSVMKSQHLISKQIDIPCIANAERVFRSKLGLISPYKSCTVIKTSVWARLGMLLAKQQLNITG